MMNNGVGFLVNRRTFALLALASGFAVGCSKSPVKGHLPTVAIRGIVKIDSQPSRRAMLQITPVESGKGKPGASGLVADDGRYTLQTYAPGDGIPKGTYTVALGPDFAKFMPVPAVTPLTIEIKESNSSFELNFQSTGKGSAGMPRKVREQGK